MEGEGQDGGWTVKLGVKNCAVIHGDGMRDVTFIKVDVGHTFEPLKLALTPILRRANMALSEEEMLAGLAYRVPETFELLKLGEGLWAFVDEEGAVPKQGAMQPRTRVWVVRAGGQVINAIELRGPLVVFRAPGNHRKPGSVFGWDVVEGDKEWERRSALVLHPCYGPTREEMRGDKVQP